MEGKNTWTSTGSFHTHFFFLSTLEPDLFFSTQFTRIRILILSLCFSSCGLPVWQQRLFLSCLSWFSSSWASPGLSAECLWRCVSVSLSFSVLVSLTASVRFSLSTRWGWTSEWPDDAHTGEKRWRSSNLKRPTGWKHSSAVKCYCMDICLHKKKSHKLKGWPNMYVDTILGGTLKLHYSITFIFWG